MSEDKECPFCDGPLIRAEDLVACGNHLCGIGHLWMTAEQWNRRAAKPSVPDTYVDYQQKRGAHADIVDEAIAAYEQWLLDDHYDAHGALTLIIERMRERRALYAATPLPVAQGAPEGWKPVPIEPTDKMTFVGQSMRYEAVNSIGAIYRAMLSAAPTPPAAPKEPT